MNRLYPIFLKLEDQRCLVVGGGDVAKRKIQSLLESGAHVLAVSRTFDGEILKLSQENCKLVLNGKNFEDRDLEGVYLVIAATDDDEVNRRVYVKSIEADILVNVVDQPNLCNFYLPASVTRGNLKIAISTGGKSPAMAKKIRKELEEKYDENYTVLIECLGEIRKELFDKYPTEVKKRGDILNKIVNSILVENISEYSKDELFEEMRKWI